jgi:DNA-binding beta-propeller fold protein YncE
LAVVVAALGWLPESAAQGQGQGNVAPKHEVDAFWPQWFPNQWQIGQVHGVAVDSRDHVWILQRQRTLTADEAGLTNNRSGCCQRAPAVMEFDPAGNFVQGWGGPFDPGFIEQRCVEPACQWPAAESGLFVDDNGFVYIGGTQGGGNGDHMVLKFTRDGTFVMQVGARGLRGGMSNDTNSAPGGRPALGNPVRMTVDVAANELYIADGLANRRVIVVDAATGLYKRHWGAYGNVPSDAALPAYNPNVVDTQFRQVHCVRIADDGLVYVCDRTSNRVQVFRKNGAFVKEFFVDRNTLGNGSAWDIAFSRDRGQSFLYLADGENNLVRIYDRVTQDALATFGRNGRSAGEFHWVHSVALGSKGDLYAGEADTGKRAQKFLARGMAPVK